MAKNRTIRFDFAPKIVAVVIGVNYGYNYTNGYVLVSGQQYATDMSGGTTMQVSWYENSVGFYDKNDAENQMNENEKTYHYICVG